jgi:hypothetical protein
MAAFPKLKTGAVAQYPITRELRAQNQTLRFVDGGQQRYRDAKGVRKRWLIQLELLDEGELAAVEEFFLEVQGAYGSFVFVDPWDGQVYEGCRLENDDAAFTSIGEMQSTATLAVIQ